MKTKIITLITLVTVLATTSLTYAANKNQAIVLATSTTINKIEASGNVEVYITNGDKDQVKVYDDYYAQNALVQDRDGVLRISSYKADKLVVMVTVSNLSSVTASDNASIKSNGKFLTLGLDVTLNNNASAQLKLDAFTAKITVNDHATADLSGSIIDYELNYSRSSSVNRTELVANNSTEKMTTKDITPIIESDNVASL